MPAIVAPGADKGQIRNVMEQIKLSQRGIDDALEKLREVARNIEDTRDRDKDEDEDDEASIVGVSSLYTA